MAKKFPLGKDKYYFTVQSGFQTITIHRKEKADAIHRFLSYQKNGKQVEWLGRWNGKKFEDSANPTAAS